MGIGESLAPATDILGGGFAKVMSYAWVIFPVIIVLIAIGGVFLIKSIKTKKRPHLPYWHSPAG